MNYSEAKKRGNPKLRDVIRNYAATAEHIESLRQKQTRAPSQQIVFRAS